MEQGPLARLEPNKTMDDGEELADSSFETTNSDRVLPGSRETGFWAGVRPEET